MAHSNVSRAGKTSGQAIECRLISFDEALCCVTRIAVPIGKEKVSLYEADDRVLATPAIAQHSVPLKAVSAMDGIAVRTADIDAGGTRLAVVGKSFAGAGFDGSIAPHECVRIFTGAPLPAGADRVVIQEDVVFEGTSAFLSRPLSGRCHVRPAGSDFHCGETLVRSGRRLRPQDLVAAAAGDLDELEVFRRPRIHIVCCGDELVPAGTAWKSPDRIPESISAGVAAIIRRNGGLAAGRTLVTDELETMTAALRDIETKADAIVVVGGASVGEKDFAKAAFAPLGMRRLFEKVAIKPGKPVWLAEMRGKPILGLPGNPTSALVTARLLLAPLVAGLAGRGPSDALLWRTARLASPIERCSDRDVFVRAASIAGGIARPLASQDSADQRALHDADLLVRLRPGTRAQTSMGVSVDVVDF